MGKKKTTAGTESQVAAMHNLTTSLLTGILKAEEVNLNKIGTKVESGEFHEDGTPVMEDYQYYTDISPAMWTVINKFIADNGVTCAVDTLVGKSEQVKNMDNIKSNRLRMLNPKKAANDE